MLVTYQLTHPGTIFPVSKYSFLIIAIGGLACVAGGYLSRYLGVKKTAGIALFLSGSCCLLSPLILLDGSPMVLIGFLLCWGMVVIADSPLFSTLVAQNSLGELRGTALTIVNCIGFSITIISIQLITLLQPVIHPSYIYMLLAIGPALGLWAMYQAKVAK
jgi:MFS family permease